jgi:transporter family-2 protein
MSSSPTIHSLHDEEHVDHASTIMEPKETSKPLPSLKGRLVAIVLMIIAGCCVALQAGFNATLNAAGGRSFASLVSFLVGLGSCLCFFAFDLLVLGTPPPSRRLRAAPWYAWAGGVLGTYYVVINILTVPKLGAATVLR